MKETENRGRVPRLRFPEFREAGEWKEKEVGDVFKVTRGEVLSMTLVADAKTDKAPYPVFSSQTKNNGLAGFYPEYLYEDSITWTTDGANAGDVNYRQGKFYCTNVCGVLINEDGNANSCIAALINCVSKKHVSYVGNPKLMNGVMSKIVVPFPSMEEQEKIAECLSSIDDLITLESQKLNSLKTHKKGLMQQLFPAEGETVPRLRFPAFLEVGNVSTLPLTAVADLVSEKISIDQITTWEYVSTENILPDFGSIRPAVKLPSVSSVTSFKPNDILVSNIRPYLKKIWQSNIFGGASNDVLVIRAKENIDAGYLAAILRSDLFIEYVMRGAKGVKMPRGELSMIQEFPVPCPCSGEQQKIANCLSSLGDLITAQSQKVEALKTHKKGLMQQLFPVLDDTPG
ncbi:restriction endonuclease subunit S [Acidithiobacillus ferriphilus]|uniref:restriction endonuclease subunit S n=1 Tax=Acidithiobacillus ferriphilus TaxID=1689834 RepID=UPI001C07DC3A|nr:restriction endonuclease subunit S [Acidithiobacillus ferriphilus]MBU2848635.1 restriction endonuclease subunit S [Acidithiobacillus ferriphilus]